MTADSTEPHESSPDALSEQDRALLELLSRFDGESGRRLLDWVSELPDGARPGPELMRRLEACARVEYGARELLQAAPSLAVPAGPSPTHLGPYRLLEPLGQGGQARVWSAVHSETGRTVALKRFHGPPPIAGSPLARAKREARAASRGQHPGIVQIYEIGDDEEAELFWIAMELVEGGRTLQHALSESSARDTTPANYRATARRFAAIAHAMQHAHSAGVVHRDLKPQNVLLTPDGEPKVADFGLALLPGESRLSETGDVFGTLRYMSPEQALSTKDVDHRTDIYGVGAMLFEAITGKDLFEGTRGERLLQLISLKGAPSPRDLDSSIPKDLASICSKALEQYPPDRYAAMDALAHDLEAFVEGRAISARRPGPAERAWMAARRRPVLTAGGLLLGGALTLAVVFGQRASVHAARISRIEARLGPVEALDAAALERLRELFMDQLAARSEAQADADEPARAAELAARLAEIAPGSYEARFAEAYRLRRFGEFAEARHLAEELVARHPEELNPLFLLRDMARDSEDWAEVERWSRAALAQEPDHVGSLAVLGLALTSQDQHQEAIQTLERALALGGDDFGVRTNLASALTRIQRFEDAMPHLVEARLLNPDDPLGHYHEAKILKGLGRLEQAKERFEASVALPGAPVDAYNSLGGLHVEAGRNHEAFEVIRMGLVHHPMDPSLADNAALWLNRMERFEESIEICESVDLDDPRYLGVLESLSFAYFGSGRTQDACEAAERYLALEGPSTDLRSLYGEIWNALGRVSKALPALEQARSLRPDDPQVNMALGMALYRLDSPRYLESAEAFLRASEGFESIRPKDHITTIRLAVGMFIRAGQADLALPHAERLPGLDSSAGISFSVLSSCYDALGRTEEAIAMAERAVELSPEDAGYRETVVRLRASLAQVETEGDPGAEE